MQGQSDTGGLEVVAHEGDDHIPGAEGRRPLGSPAHPGQAGGRPTSTLLFAAALLPVPAHPAGAGAQGGGDRSSIKYTEGSDLTTALA